MRDRRRRRCLGTPRAARCVGTPKGAGHDLARTSYRNQAGASCRTRPSGRRLRGRRPPARNPPQTRARARTTDTVEQGRAPVRRRALGAARTAGARRVHLHAPSARRDRAPPAGASRRDARGPGRVRGTRPRHDRPRRAGHPARRASVRLAVAAAAGGRGGSHGRRSELRRSAVPVDRPRHADGRPRRLRDRAAPEPSLHAGHLRVGLLRRQRQHDGQDRAPARDAERRRDLPPPSALRRARRLPDLERRPRRSRDARGRRHARHRERLRPHRDGGAHPPRRRRAVRAAAVRDGRRDVGDRGRHAQDALCDAPRHGHDDGRP